VGETFNRFADFWQWIAQKMRSPDPVAVIRGGEGRGEWEGKGWELGQEGEGRDGREGVGRNGKGEGG